MPTEAEYLSARQLGRTLAQEHRVRETQRIVAEDFSAPTALGVIRLREHPLFRSGFQVGELIAVLGEVFHRRNPGQA